jgi:acyl-CoA synthetase (AMP-forming)/AMP-acid ligase II
LAIGLTPGDRIGVWAPNTINWYLNALAAAKAGLVSVGINPAYQVREPFFYQRFLSFNVDFYDF